MTEASDSRVTRSRWQTWALLAVIVAVGAFFRLHDLGLSAFRADEGFFWDIFQQPLTPGDVFGKWMQLQGLSGQFPFSAAFTKWFVEFFHLPVTHFTVRLPSALWGIAAIGAAFGAGRLFGGVRFGLALAAVLAFNPFHIQVSRESYHYAPLVCGAFLGLWVTLLVLEHIRSARSLSVQFYLVHALGIFLLTYSQPSGWPLAAMVVGTVLFALGRNWFKTRKLGTVHGVVLLTYVFLAVPLLASDWGLKQQLQTTSSEVKAQMLALFGQGDPLLPATWRAITCYGWGDTPLRAAFTVAALILGFVVCGRKCKADKQYLVVPAFLLVGFAFVMISMRSTARPFAPRYVTVLIPLYLAVLTAGLIGSVELLKLSGERRKTIRDAGSAMLLAMALLLWLLPAYWCTQLDGKPTPYKKINAWVDANLPKGTPILVDRWFEPWCELRVEQTKNVVFTYTIPDEPVKVYLDNHWRDTVMNFFHKYPDAAFCELTKHYWEVPTVGPWYWPREFFAHRVAFTNKAGLELREMGLANREDYYASQTNRLIVELFYNTREDLLAKAKAADRPCALFLESNEDKPIRIRWNNYLPYVSFVEEGWGYTKTPDFRDWRVLEERASFALYNLTGQTNAVTLTVRSAAASAAKEVHASNGQRFTFPASQIVEWKLELTNLPPGKTILTLTDDHWQRAKVPLFVERVMIEPVR